MKKPAARPWWVDGGTETCHACTHRYVYQVELRCTGCDRGLCAHCAVIERVTREAWCPECSIERGEE
jgi:hypothetical protein